MYWSPCGAQFGDPSRGRADPTSESSRLRFPASDGFNPWSKRRIWCIPRGHKGSRRRSLAFYEAALKPLSIKFFLPYKGEGDHPDLWGFW